MSEQTKFIFITGGVVSSLGKGLASASLASILQARGFKVRMRKLDPYLNVDPGTMSPYQHGEVFVTDDGAETDLDLGHYERFSGVACKKNDSITTGKIYQRVIDKERHGDYLGATIQVIPHVTNEIKDFIVSDINDEDFVLCEIGGTVGDIEGQPYLEAIRQVAYDLGRDRAMFIHVTLLPYIPTAGELKTKPTQHSVKKLQEYGIQPDMLLCRSQMPIPQNEKRKIAPETIYNYLDWLTEAFVIDRVHRYDLRGKAILKTQEKYYLGDIGLLYAVNGRNNFESYLPGILENIVYHDLVSHNYDIKIGKNGDKEICKRSNKC